MPAAPRIDALIALGPRATAVACDAVLFEHMSATGQTPRSLAIPMLSVRTEDGRAFRFSRPFHIGREHDCDVRIEDAHVSRKHVIVSFGNGHWRLRDQQSGNGVFVDGQRVDTASIDIEPDDPARRRRSARGDGAGVACPAGAAPGAAEGRRRDDDRGELRGAVLRNGDRRGAGGRPDDDDPQGLPPGPEETEARSTAASSRSWRWSPSSRAATRTTATADRAAAGGGARTCSTR